MTAWTRRAVVATFAMNVVAVPLIAANAWRHHLGTVIFCLSAVGVSSICGAVGTWLSVAA